VTQQHSRLRATFLIIKKYSVTRAFFEIALRREKNKNKKRTNGRAIKFVGRVPVSDVENHV